MCIYSEVKEKRWNTEEAERDRRGGGQEMRKKKDRCIKNGKQMDKLRLKESERSVTERVEETHRHNERGRGETPSKIETVRLSGETVSVTVSHSRIKRHASICCC